MSIEVIKPGSHVVVRGVEAIVHTVSICGQESCVTYHISWMDGNSRNTAWVYPQEIDTKRPAMVPIGFRVLVGERDV